MPACQGLGAGRDDLPPALFPRPCHAAAPHVVFQAISMEPRTNSAVLALAITAVAIMGNFAVTDYPSHKNGIPSLASLLAIPGRVVAWWLGFGHAPHHTLCQEDIGPYLITFLIWWGGIYGARAMHDRRYGPP